VAEIVKRPPLHERLNMSREHRIALVVGSFHKHDCEVMVAAARRAAESLGLLIVTEVWVPGSYEKPLAAKRLLLRDDIHGAVVLGIIERGETAHGLVMGQAVATALLRLQLELMKPIGFGILGPEINPTQIPSRLGSDARAAVDAVHQMLVLFNISDSPTEVEE